MAHGFPERREHRLPTALRAPIEARTWRESLYLLLNLPMGVIGFVFTVTMLSLGAGLLVTFLGLPVLAAMLAGCRGLGVVERERARRCLGIDVASPEPLRRRPGQGLMSWLGGQLTSGASWRHVLYFFVHFPWGVFTFSVTVTFVSYGWGLLTYPLWQWVFPAFTDQPGLQLYGNADGDGWWLDSPFEMAMASALGLLLGLAAPWVIRGMAYVDRGLVAGLLGPSRLASRVWELESDRGTVVDTAAADLRRIERDLHDGAQARLVALAMDLGLAKEKLQEDPETAATMVEEAHGEVKLALQELRDLARGIHPAVLTDRGLDAALSSLAARCAVPVRVSVDLPGRPVPAIEGIAYFTVSELLQNISKHSGASRATVDLWRSGDRLMIHVVDNGRGGASPAQGSGLAGLVERLEAVDGVLAVDSPAGGPTAVAAELPWRS
ncbi:sensor histidine kinase [Actinacidiphila sp. bgisy167]|uniref:sensor histidine kinase n=1 Tax=Actinacidiphila sp. bgisy167 TaxID=3413797 RepID=UPI003D737C5D